MKGYALENAKGLSEQYRKKYDAKLGKAVFPNKFGTIIAPVPVNEYDFKGVDEDDFLHHGILNIRLCYSGEKKQPVDDFVIGLIKQRGPVRQRSKISTPSARWSSSQA